MMKNKIKIIVLVYIGFGIFITSCRKLTPAIPEEQELITTLRLIITDSVGVSKIVNYRIENGFGNTSQGTIEIDTIKLEKNNHYHMVAELYNEKYLPTQDITEEVIAEKNEHLFLYNTIASSGAGVLSFVHGSADDNGMPFNQTIDVITLAKGTSLLQVNLMHEPSNKNGKTPDESGGETDVEAIFPVVIN